MSELKSFNSERIYWAVEQVEQEAGDINDLHLDDNLFYIKSEADKVIEKKDKEICRLKRALYKACANWAMAESYSVLNDVATANRWVHTLRKLKAKLEEYK